MLPKLGLDLDGVIVNFNDQLVEDYNKRYLPVITADSIDYDFELLGDLIFTRFKIVFNEPGFFKKLKPLPNAITIATKLLDMGIPTVICTAPARNNEGLINGLSAAEKFDWVQEHLPFWGNEIIITKDKHYVDVDMLIDDYPPNITLWCQKHPNGIGFLVDQSWNRRFSHFPNNSVRGSLEKVIPFIQKFWCEERGVFAYRLDELHEWR